MNRSGLCCLVLAAAVSTGLVTGCASTRPTSPPDAIDCRLSDFVVEDIFSQWNLYRRDLLQTKSLDDPRPSFNVLALSAGGEFGAYGAGVLQGWSSVGTTASPSPRRDIQVVTGVSTGAILATHAFLSLDDAGVKQYRSLSGPQVYRRRSVISILFSNSIFDSSGKDQLIDKVIDQSLIDAVAASGSNRFLYLGVVDLDTGRFLRIDMVGLAKSLTPVSRRDACYRAVVGASSAIPIAFAPKFVDSMLLVDGGARRHLFITAPPAEALVPEVERRLFSIVHGDLDVGCTKVKNGVLPIAERVAELFSDQSFKDSIRLTDSLARAPVSASNATPLFKTFYASAASAAKVCAPKLSQCQSTGESGDEDLFCNPFMNCLADQGEKDGNDYASGRRPWLDFEALDLSSVPACVTNPAPRAFVR